MSNTIYTSKHFTRHGQASATPVASVPGPAGAVGARGPQGEPGVGIVAAKLEAGKLIFTLSNGTTLDAGNLLELIKGVMPAAPAVAQPAPTVRAVGAARPPV
jgi:hypothetical protein